MTRSALCHSRFWLFFLVAIACCATAVQGQTYTDLFDFDDTNLYGSTTSDKTHSAGTVFKITPSGTYSELFDFAGTGAGGFPLDPPVGGPDGALYVTTPINTFLIYRITTAGVATSIATLGA